MAIENCFEFEMSKKLIAVENLKCMQNDFIEVFFVNLV